MQKRKQEIVTLVVVFTAVVVASALAVYFLGGGRRATPETVRQGQPPDAVLSTPADQSSPSPQNNTGESFIDRVFGSQQTGASLTGDSWAETMGRIFSRFLLAAILGGAL